MAVPQTTGGGPSDGGRSGGPFGGRPSGPSSNPPIFNAPPIITFLIALILIAHVIATLMPIGVKNFLLVNFSFLPIRYIYWPEIFSRIGAGDFGLVFALLSDIPPLVTHAFLHADFMHVGLNAVWLLCFGTPVAKRIGATRFLALAATAAMAGALFHLAYRWGSPVPMVGASGAISGLFGAAVRFILAAPLGGPGSQSLERYRLPRLPLFDKRIIAVTVIYALMNFVLAVTAVGSLSPDSGSVAWDAHLGGFLAGLILFPLFDKQRSSPPSYTNGSGPGDDEREYPPYLRRVK